MIIHSKINKVDCIIIGAGIFGLHTARILRKKNKKVILIEKSLAPFSRASKINQARVHNGYHYPRCKKTAESVAYYYEKFNKDFHFAINKDFKHIYGIALKNSKISSTQFIKFCNQVKIPLTQIDHNKYFQKKTVESAFRVKEPVFNYNKIKDFLLNESDGTKIIYGTKIKTVEKNNSSYLLSLSDNTKYSAPLVVNATYAGLNNIIEKFDQELFKLKYELCEMIFCKVSKPLQNIGITVMDGDYFSVIPFGKEKFHSLTSVQHTPHKEIINKYLENTIKNKNSTICEMHNVKNCFICSQQLKSTWHKMNNLSKSFLKLEFKLKYINSWFEIKAILENAEKNDSRPTIIKTHTIKPTLISIFSGKINTIYDIEEYINSYYN